MIDKKILSEAYLEGSRLNNRIMDGLDFGGSNLIKSHFFQVSLRNCNFRPAQMNGAAFLCCDLRGATFPQHISSMEGAEFSGSKYDRNTTFPEGFDPVARGLVEVSE